MEIYIGKRLTLPASHAVDMLGHKIYPNLPCKVVYINRKHRYYTVEFDCENRPFRESYKLEAGDRFGK